MIETITVIVFFAILSGLFYLTIRSRREFIIKISSTEASLIKGEVDEEFVTDIWRICQLWNITEGTVTGIQVGGRIKIHVGGGIAKSHRQAFQNAWNHQANFR